MIIQYQTAENKDIDILLDFIHDYYDFEGISFDRQKFGQTVSAG